MAVPGRYITARITMRGKLALYLGFWLAGQDSNLQPPDPKFSPRGYPQLSVVVRTWPICLLTWRYSPTRMTGGDRC